MKTYKLELVETLSRIVEVEAESYDEAFFYRGVSHGKLCMKTLVVKNKKLDMRGNFFVL